METLSTTKRYLSYEDINQTNPLKKHKANVTNITNMNQQKSLPNKEFISLSERMRPTCIDDYIGQEKVIGSHTILKQLLIKGHIPSMIFWGPPGCGKTSLANVISKLIKEIHGEKVHIINLSATSSGVSNIRNIVNTTKTKSKLSNQAIVFMDEIHRFNKLQQDIFLPHIEAGTFTLIGTTTENPSYSLNSALLSRCRIFVLNKLTVSNIVDILYKAISSINGEICSFPQKTLLTNLKYSLSCDSKPCFSINQMVIDWLAEVCDGDARVALNSLELAVKSKVSNELSPSHLVSITLDDVKESLKQAHTLSDKHNNTHHLYSALHKSIKAGKENASVYWLARIMAVKEDPVDIARRLVRISSEDIGLADPDALGIAVHTMHGCQMIGMPECDVILTQCVIYLTRAPKSQLVYNALKSVKNIIINHKDPQPTVPVHIRDNMGQEKHYAIFGCQEGNLLHKEKDVQTYLPFSLQHVDFFSES